MGIYSVSGRTGATASATGAPIFAIWNPSSPPVEIALTELGIYFSGAAPVGLNMLGVTRISTRGTPGSTLIPDPDNAWEKDISPVSVAVVDLAPYSVNPTVVSPYLEAAAVGGTVAPPAGSGYVELLPYKVYIDPGMGVHVGVQWAGAQIMPACVVYVVWEEG